MTFPMDTPEGLTLPTDYVLREAREAKRWHDEHGKPYTAGVIADCIATIERLAGDAQALPVQDQYQGTCEDHRLISAGYKVCGSDANRQWHWHGPDGKWHDGYRSEYAAVNAALRDLESSVSSPSPPSPERSAGGRTRLELATEIAERIVSMARQRDETCELKFDESEVLESAVEDILAALPDPAPHAEVRDMTDKATAWDAISEKNAEIQRLRFRLDYMESRHGKIDWDAQVSRPPRNGSENIEGSQS